MMLSDWAAFRLSGVATSEPSVASSSQMLELANRQWSERVTRLAGLRADIFLQVLAAGERVGSVTRRAAAETGLAPGTAVVAGGGDTQIGLLGMGLTGPGRIGAVAGTSTPLLLTVDHVLIGPEERVSTNCYVLPGLWTLDHFDRRHMFRAALETMAFGIRSNADQLAAVVQARPYHINVCGGQGTTQGNRIPLAGDEMKEQVTSLGVPKGDGIRASRDSPAKP